MHDFSSDSITFDFVEDTWQVSKVEIVMVEVFQNQLAIHRYRREHMRWVHYSWGHPIKVMRG